MQHDGGDGDYMMVWHEVIVVVHFLLVPSTIFQVVILDKDSNYLSCFWF